MTALDELSHEYPNTAQFLGPWLSRLLEVCRETYAVVLGNFTDSASEPGLRLLESDVTEAVDYCANLEDLVAEKDPLPTDCDEANRVVLDKLSEVHAIVGLHRLGFTGIVFSEHPDLTATRGENEYGIEVKRLGPSPATAIRSDLYDQRHGALEKDGWFVGLASQDGKFPSALSYGLKGAIAQKALQLLRSRPEGNGIICISAGRDYFAAGKYETFGLPGFARGMSDSVEQSLDAALAKPWEQFEETQVDYSSVALVVLSTGADRAEIMRSGPTVS